MAVLRNITSVVYDLMHALGKVIGGGFPLAAITGRADIMAHFDKAKVGDDAFLMQIGTLSGNPVAAAAGLATLEILRRPGAYEQIFATRPRADERAITSCCATPASRRR